MKDQFDDSRTKIRTRMFKRKRLLYVPFLICVILMHVTSVKSLPSSSITSSTSSASAASSAMSTNSVNSINLQEPTPLHNGAVEMLANGNNINNHNHSIIRLKLSEKHFSDYQNVHVKPTFSPIFCDRNATDLLIIDKNGTELTVSLNDIDFKEHSAAYLCLNFDNTEQMYHLGLPSQFERLNNSRNRRNTLPDTDDTASRFYQNIVRSVDQQKGNIRIDGLRVENSDKSVSYSDDGLPEFIAASRVTLRLFGSGFTEDMMIAFTEESNSRGGACLGLAGGKFPVQKDGLKDHTAVVDIMVPIAIKTPYYVCAKNKDAPQLEKNVDFIKPFVHQGTDLWLQIASKDLILPVWVAVCIICSCLMFSALFSGLNLGLMSLDRTELKILVNTGNEKEREYAKVIQPVRDHGNYLLCSILLGNVLVNSTFTILLDSLTSGMVAVVGSTLLIVIFGEITPQAVCSRHGLAVGAKTILVTKFIMLLTFPLAYPTSRFLDFLLGEEIGNVYNRERLKELVRVTNDVNDLDKDEVNIISGALEMRRKTVAGVMTHIEDAFMLSYDAILDFETVSEIMKSGFSRIPVYEGSRHNVQKLLLIKDLALIDPDDNTPLRTLCEFYQNYCYFVFEDTTLDVVFKQFKAGQHGHMAFVRRVNNEGDGDPFYETIGLITLEDVIEEMIQAEIMDETDIYTDNRTKTKRKQQLGRKQDFTIFAERRDNQQIRISPQLTLATFQYLSTTVDAFKPDSISETILRRLLNQDVIHHVKSKGKDKNDVSLVIYQQGKPVDYFVLILEGRVEVTVGLENLMFECGPFTYFGVQALAQNVGVVESNQPIQGSLQSLNLDALIKHTFVPDYSVKANTEVFYVAIKRTLYLAAKRATLMERAQKFGGDLGNNEPMDDEVEKLLHSLDEDDKSISAHTANLNITTPRTSKAASPTENLIERNSNGPGSIGIETIAGAQNVRFQTNRRDTEESETDALLSAHI